LKGVSRKGSSFLVSDFGFLIERGFLREELLFFNRVVDILPPPYLNLIEEKIDIKNFTVFVGVSVKRIIVDKKKYL